MSAERTAVITGASTGIGEAAARRLARERGYRLVLVARREERLSALARELGRATVLAVDLTRREAPLQVRELLEREHGGQIHLLVNNAGAAWRGTFAETGWVNVERHMKLNFEAPVRLTEALLPLLRATARTRAGNGPVAVVNVGSTASRVSRPGSGAYSASKFALAGWTDALRAEEQPHRVHVGLVLPGFVATEGFPATELRARALTRWIVSSPGLVAEAIVEAGPGGKTERYVPRPYWLAAAARLLAPGLVRRAIAGGSFTTATGSDQLDAD
ncbi:MAG TPA: SDR family NAD(P)-dependent oxidoreductase [Solirubrobacteraceae bacterium]